MKNYIIILIVLLVYFPVKAQQKLDTIYANEQKNVALFFPKPIRQGITGSSNYVFTYNREKTQYFGLLQASPGEESNLLAVTNDGQVYSYILKYSERLPELNYFINAEASIGFEKPQKKRIDSLTKSMPIAENRSIYFQKFSEHLLKLKPKRLATKRKKGMKLHLQRKVYNASEVYLVLELENNSGIDFEVDYLNVYRLNGNTKRKASFQKLKFDMVYGYNIPKIIKHKTSNRFVYVVPKFVIGSNEKLELDVSEKNGNRKIILNQKL